MLKCILKIAGAAAALALLLFAGGIQAPPSAQALIPPPCPVGAGPPGAVTYRVVATLPAGPPAGGVCITMPGAPPIGFGAVVQVPPACPPPGLEAAVGAGNGAAGQVWANWVVPCVFPGQTVILDFMGPLGGPLGLLPFAALWDNGAVGNAWLWPAACPAGPPAVGGTVAYIATAAAPGGPPGPYGGVCMSVPTAGPINPLGAGVLLNPAGCGMPAVSPPPPLANPVFGPFSEIAVNQISVHWDMKCAAAGSVVKVGFMGPPGLAGVCAGCATWLGSSAMGSVTITLASSVGGVAEAPDAAAVSAAPAAGGPGVRGGWYIGGGGAALVLIVGAGAWYIRRRQLA